MFVKLLTSLGSSLSHGQSLIGQGKWLGITVHAWPMSSQGVVTPICAVLIAKTGHLDPAY